MATTTEDRAQAIEARARRAMATVTKAPRGWDAERVRAEEMAYIDRLLDEHNALTRVTWQDRAR